ncbi:DUF6221 family protein [Streptomyces qaidamensis]|uniref:DUF6221 family protein n=1 Tax=Streptomyces qaidamensis TaxID=1783515 RepID=UPI0036E89EDE
MDELAQWLRAQIDEDERIARATSWTHDANAWHAEPSPFGARDGGQRWYVEDAMDDGVVSHVDPAASDDEGVARHIAEWDPARVLREIDAKRRMFDRFTQADAERTYIRERYRAAVLEGDDDRARRHQRELHEATLRLQIHRAVAGDLAAACAGRPGYREEWRP